MYPFGNITALFKAFFFFLFFFLKPFPHSLCCISYQETAAISWKTELNTLLSELNLTVTFTAGWEENRSKIKHKLKAVHFVQWSRWEAPIKASVFEKCCVHILTCTGLYSRFKSLFFLLSVCYSSSLITNSALYEYQAKDPPLILKYKKIALKKTKAKSTKAFVSLWYLL